MSRYLFDCETDGLLDTLTTIHCLVLKDVDTGEVFSGHHGSLQCGITDNLRRLEEAEEIIGHNIIKFDIPALQKVYPWFSPKGTITDTLVLSRLIWADIRDRDAGLIRNGKFPGGRLTGSHGLEAWGHRLGMMKGDYSKEMKAQGLDPWASWNQSMQDYCVLDVEVTEALYKRIEAKKYAQTAIDLEHEVATLCWKMEQNGFPFDVQKAGKLYGELAGKRAELEIKLKEVFKPWWVSEGIHTPPRTTNRKRSDLGVTLVRKGKKGDLWVEQPVTETFTQGVPYSKVYLETFNPGSRHHIANRLKALYGWEPSEYTDNGEPKVDESVLGKLPYPEAILLSEFFTVQKRIGQLAEGKKGWLNLEKSGKIHGTVNTNGAVTGRCTHAYPNVAQVPSVKGDDWLKKPEASYVYAVINHVHKSVKVLEHPQGDIGKKTPVRCLVDGTETMVEAGKLHVILMGEEGGWGAECRELFGAPKGWVMIGADMSGLELRCLGHFMAKYDGGEYAKIVVEGDIHTVNMTAAGLPNRPSAKTFIYAYLYGAGDIKIGSIVAPNASEEEQKRIGKRLKKSFLDKTPALKALREAVGTAAKRGYLVGLDGRILNVRSEHAALNTLLQSAGALCCKKWIVLVDQELKARGYRHGPDGDYMLCAYVHDEQQLAARTPEIAQVIGQVCIEQAAKAGEFFKFRCPLTGEFKIGNTWRDTH